MFAALSASHSRIFSIVSFFMSPAGNGGAAALAAWADGVQEPDHA
ncbi:putative membrane protein [Synechococcus sp. PROS-9-1]|nr:putative membrane protein [Synechococcus sp. PROS-9-1]